MYLKIKKGSKIVLGMICSMIIIFTGFLPAFSADLEKGTINLICKSEDEKYDNVQWNLYKVANRQADAKLVLIDDFVDYSVSLDDESSSALQNVAYTLENYAVLDNIAPISTKITDVNGKLNFNDIENGMYLLCGQSWIDNQIRYIPSPMLIEFSDISEKNLNVYPKFESFAIADKDVEYFVEKIWQVDSKFMESQPNEVKIELYKDNILQETVILNELNNWEYSWVSEPSALWRVKETIVADNYNVVYRTHETTFIVENRYYLVSSVPTDSSDLDSSKDSGTSSTTGSDNSAKEKLPQTGLLWWPVPVLSLVGLIMISIGYRVNKRKGK